MNQTTTNLLVNTISFLKHPSIQLKRKIHPLLLKQMPGMRDFDLKFINQKPEIEGPIIYIINHTNMHDAPIACEIIQDHFYVLIAKQKLSFINNVFFALNGNIRVDRDSSKSGAKATKKMINLLNSGANIVMFSEKTWCIKPSSPINHLRWGWIKIAKESNATILPIALEYYELTDNCCYINFGEPFKVDKNKSEMEQNNKLEDTFATLKAEIWQQFPIQKRSLIPSKLWDAIMTWRYYELGTNKEEMEIEKKYVVGYNNDPDTVFNSKEFQIGLKKLNKIYKNI